jgi:hypothetical protein
MPNFSNWNIKRLRALLNELHIGGLRTSDMQIILEIETLIEEKTNA